MLVGAREGGYNTSRGDGESSLRVFLYLRTSFFRRALTSHPCRAILALGGEDMKTYRQMAEVECSNCLRNMELMNFDNIDELRELWEAGEKVFCSVSCRLEGGAK